MKSFFQLSHDLPEALPGELAEDDVRYPPALVRAFLQEYTAPGDRVLDPFAGFGTTLTTAEHMGREAYGVELDPVKAGYIRERLAHPERLIQGDARRVDTFGLPQFHFAMTSPPYMNIDDETDPLTDYRTNGTGYRSYLKDLKGVFAQVAQLMLPAGVVVIEASNLKRASRVTPLAWDIASQVSQVLHFDGEVVIGWDRYRYGYQHSYCLVFSAL